MTESFWFPEHEIGYEEKGEYHTYLGVADMGDFFDLRVCMATDAITATRKMEDLGGKLCRLVLLSDCLITMKEVLSDPNYAQRLNPILISNKPSPIV